MSAMLFGGTKKDQWNGLAPIGLTSDVFPSSLSYTIEMCNKIMAQEDLTNNKVCYY